MDPLHLTEFASERYFSKLNQLSGPEDGQPSSSTAPAADSTPHTFILPLGNPRHPIVDDELAPTLRPSEQKKRSLGHDLSTLRTQRRPTFSGSFGSLRSKVTITHKSPTIVEHKEILAEETELAAPVKYVVYLASYHCLILTSHSVSPSAICFSLYPTSFKRTS